ncbi:MAG: type II toxin-antitoxin system VapC family toxin [Nostocoides sp.]
MIVDTSALIAVLNREPERDAFVRAMMGDARIRLGAPTVLEAHLVVGRDRGMDLDDLLKEFDARIEAFDARLLSLARHAHDHYGRGSGSKARLNFGDCFSYALAKDTGEPLLFKGSDFTHTDVAPAIVAKG